MSCPKIKGIPITSTLWQVTILLDLLLNGSFFGLVNHTMHLQLVLCQLGMQLCMLLWGVIIHHLLFLQCLLWCHGLLGRHWLFVSRCHIKLIHHCVGSHGPPIWVSTTNLCSLMCNDILVLLFYGRLYCSNISFALNWSSSIGNPRNMLVTKP